MRVDSKWIASYVVLGAIFLALASVPGYAQDEKRVHFNLGGGPTFMAGDLGQHFDTGWGPAIGVSLDAKNKKVGFQFEYAYRWFHVNNELPIGATAFSANHQTHQLDFNLMAHVTKPDAKVRGYIVAGPGMYYRKVEITQYVGSGIICDPYWYVCGTYPVTDVIGSRGGWDFGFNVGGGVGFPIGEAAEFFIESRYHYVAGPDIPTPANLPPGSGTGGSTNGQYIPLTFGIRF